MAKESDQTYKANQTVYHMGQGVTFIAYIGEDRALVEVDVYGDYDDSESGIYSHSVTVLVDVGALTEKKDDLWPIAKAELAKHRETLADIKEQIDEASAEERGHRANSRALGADARKFTALNTILREMNEEATHYIHCYEWWGDPEIRADKPSSDMAIEVRLEQTRGQWEISLGHFKRGEHYYIPCFGEDDLAVKLVAFCERRINCNSRSLSVKMEEFCAEHNVTSPKILAAIQKRKEMAEEEKKKRIAKAKAELATLQG